MSHFRPLLLLVAYLCVAGSHSTAAEIRTYRFVPDGSLPYMAGCGECALPYLGARADVAGTFIVSLDPVNSTGQLLALDSHLVNYFEILASGTGSILQPILPETDSGIIPPYVGEYQPPLDGSLESLGGALILSSGGYRPLLYGSVGLFPPFTITMQGGRATFDMHVPIIDYEITVTGAQAVEVTPEPSSWLLALIATTLLHAARPRRSPAAHVAA